MSRRNRRWSAATTRDRAMRATSAVLVRMASGREPSKAMLREQGKRAYEEWRRRQETPASEEAPS